ncbi:hypothetical protein TREMEDRAFT_67766 [Tremella mesenterica DSM 1558]|uniref:uncharacterized protein n=1 Tax=Tremella mesenterica (strain ATCC 24925 / CBS 8224 / DSM 1558 / NBRC 9311 / NRRL Y-6157 / RJB 2259-6 / UBC 559-6) TaxID=578456 RepID=UPI0003F49473|nr:uncharacterized protein TREMEDRAFT_67766 [Tremella mesenterica DSM 1558]EIW71438.1 hypothetical protein TREMEDRAFT_67766 [Tremella mesenterica DSM 1558]
MSSSEPLFPRVSEPDPSRPSLFELLAQDQLRDLLHPVVRYVLTYFTQRYPRYFLRALNHHEEVFALLLLIVERHHLSKHNASISEHFYQLRLSSVGETTPRLDRIAPKRNILSRKQRWGLLVFLVGLPYIRARLQDHFEQLSGSTDPETPTRPQPLTKIQHTFKLLYPYMNISLDLLFLSYDVAYMFDKTSYYRPWHRWLGVKVRRITPDDITSGQSSNWIPPLLPTLLLALKAAEWWYSPSSPRTSRTTKDDVASRHASILPPRPLPILPSSGLLPTPPPSPPASPRRQDVASVSKQRYMIGEEEYGTCPICNKKWQNPAVLPSGWVVCWRCGWDAIEGIGDEEEESDDGEVVSRRKRGRCPITGMMVRSSELRRVLV